MIVHDWCCRIVGETLVAGPNIHLVRFVLWVIICTSGVYLYTQYRDNRERRRTIENAIRDIRRIRSRLSDLKVGSSVKSASQAVPITDLESKPQTGLVSQPPVPVRPTAVTDITTAMETASSVRTPWRAITHRFATNAQIEALANAEQLALATAAAAEAETKGMEALMRRADRLTEIQIRQELEPAVREDRIDALRAQLKLNDEGRKTQRLQAERTTLEAKHAREATKLFKELKFELGRIRMRARHNDAEVDGKTAEAAVVKIASELTKLTRQQSPDLAAWIDQHITLTEVAIEEEAADGETSSEKRAELAVLRRLRANAGGA